MKSKLANREYFALTTDELLYAYGCTGQIDKLEAFIRRHQAQLQNFLQLQTNPSYAYLLSKLIWQEVAKNADDYQQQCSSKAWLFNVAHLFITQFYRQYSACSFAQYDWHKSGQRLLDLSKAKFKLPNQIQLYPFIRWQHMRTPEYAAKILSKLKSSEKYVYLLSFANLSIHDISFICQRPYQDVIANIKGANRKITKQINMRLFEKMLNDKLLKTNQNAIIRNTLAAVIDEKHTTWISKALTNTLSSLLALSVVFCGAALVFW